MEEVLRAVEASAAPVISEHQRMHATMYLEQIKQTPESYHVAIEILDRFSGVTSTGPNILPLLFALQIFRHHLTFNMHSPSSRLAIRQHLMQRVSTDHQVIDSLVANSIANILTMCLKWDYPELWPSAFDDIFQMTSLGDNGTTMIVRILSELDMEVVLYDDKRTHDEVAHNMIIKDMMRVGEHSVVERIIMFLCDTSIKCRLKVSTLSVKCLETIVDYIGWIDINLVINNVVLTFLYSNLQDKRMMAVVCKCLSEIVKKGMDEHLKIRMLHSIQLIPVLLQLQIRPLQANDMDEDDDAYEQLGMLVDMIYLTLVGFWHKLEETTLLTHIFLNSEHLDISSFAIDTNLVNDAAVMMNAVFPLVLTLFAYNDTDVSRAVMPSLNRFTSLLKQQLKSSQSIDSLLQRRVLNEYFIADQYINKLLMTIYTQIQYDVDFGFDANDDDDALEIEVRN
jgi:exportin-T